MANEDYMLSMQDADNTLMKDFNLPVIREKLISVNGNYQQCF